MIGMMTFRVTDGMVVGRLFREERVGQRPELVAARLVVSRGENRGRDR